MKGVVELELATIADVKAYVEAHPEERQRVLEVERANRNRVTLVAWLEGGDDDAL